MFRRGGLIQTASNGRDAGLAAAEFRPDVAIINVGIEDVPATSLIQRLHQSPVTRDARLIAIASKGTSAEANDAKKAGANAFHATPLNMKGLGKAIKAEATEKRVANIIDSCVFPQIQTIRSTEDGGCLP